MKDIWRDGKLVECEHGFCNTCGEPRNLDDSGQYSNALRDAIDILSRVEL